jgi:hypothetical protein
MEKPGVLGGVDVVDASCEHGDRAVPQGCFMRGGVDAARQPGDDANPASPRPLASIAAILRPATEAFLDPTMAIAGDLRHVVRL